MFYFDRFEELRSSLGITKKFIATALGRRETICQAWKNGKSEPNNEQIKIVADILRTTPAYLRGETTNPAPDDLGRNEKKPATSGDGPYPTNPGRATKEDAIKRLLPRLSEQELEDLLAQVKDRILGQ